MNTAGAVVLALVLLLLAAGAGWVIFTRVRAARLGVRTHPPSLSIQAGKPLTNHHPPPQLPPPPLKSYIPFLSSSSSASYGGPSPRPGGLTGWINDRFRFSRNRNTRTAAGAYEGSSSAGGAYGNDGGYSGGRGQPHHLDDDAWDSRVVGGYNPYEEERELGIVSHAQSGGAPHGEGYRMNLAGEEEHEEEERGRPRSRSPVTGAGVAGAGAGAAKSAKNPFGDEAEPSNISLRGVSPRPMDGTSFAGRKAARGEDDRRSLFREDV